MSKPRRLVLDDGVWRYRIDGNLIELWTPAGRKMYISSWRAAGEPNENCWVSSCAEDGPAVAITPGLLRRYIEANRETM